jgi:cyclase
MSGYDLDAIEEVSCAVTVPVIAMGGAGTLSHLRDAVSRGASAVAAGSMFVYFGPRRAVLVNYPSGGLDGDAPR